MVEIAEKKNAYLIPIENTDPDWVQTQKIPVSIHTNRDSGRCFTYLTFPLCQQKIGPEKQSPLKITAGGWDYESIETVGQRIRTQMISKLEYALAVLNTPNAHPIAALEIAQIGQYFSKR